jgi:tetratricopeptide (TPR) repeat protein
MPSRFNPRARDFVPNNMVSRTINSSQVQPRFYSPQTKASLRHQMSNSDNVPLVDSMSDDNLLNEFFEKMKQFKREQYKQACKYVEYCLEVFPPNLHDKLFLEIAERAKRANELQESQRWYQRLNVQKKHFVQGWLDHAKLMEEQGFLSESVELLLKGLSHCGINEQLVSKLLKLYELQGNYVDARGVLSRLRDLPLEKSWKMLLEGALLESRIGNLPTARKVFRYLLDNLHPHGPIYYEAYKAEASCEEYENALAFVEEGLSILPKYGPLWFALFHLLEKLGEPHERLRESLDKAVLTISKELVWKVYFEGGQIEERQWNLVAAREFYEKSAQQALVTLRWKVWMAWARLELMDDNEEAAKSFLDKALREVPAKTKSVILLECTRVEEYFKKLDKAREYIMQAQNEAKHEWKVFLEAVLLEMRCGNIQRAIHQVQEALKVHQRTGRLWALLIQLQYVNGEEAQLKEFMLALKEVPKSGEVWCEGARIRMNPTYACFDLEKAQEYLRYAINFTPQYGDSFIEYLKLQLLLNGPSQQWSNILEFSPDDGNNNNSKTLSYFEQKCVVADPNYGPLWYFCKVSPMDSTREVLKRAKQLLLIELSKNKEIFQTRMIEKHSLPSTAGKTSLPSENNFASQNYQDSNVIFTIYNNKDNKNDLNLMNQLNSDMQQQQNYHVKFVERERFITALPYLLQTFNCTNLELSTRRKLIFGFSDNIA